jgi:hypothetical protein
MQNMGVGFILLHMYEMTSELLAEEYQGSGSLFLAEYQGLPVFIDTI